LSALLSLAMVSISATAGGQDLRTPGIVVAPAETLYVEVSGKGDPVVIVPGIWSSAYAFRKVTPRLASAGVRVIVVEPLGVAFSSRPRGADYSMTAQSRRIAAVLDSLGVTGAVFVGQALSASMVLRLAIESPGLVRGMVSLEGGASEESATPGLRRGLAIASFLFRIFPSHRLIRYRVRTSLENVSGDKSWITPETVDAYVASFNTSITQTFAAYRAMASSKEAFSLGPRMNTLTFPVELMIGTAPHYGGLEPSEIAQLEKHLRELRITRIEGAGHLLNEERPAEVAAAILKMRRALRADN
jgi:pimeloyl-ACP methyl ester carboxylesterase